MQYLDDDIVDLRRDDGSTWQYYWGDAVEVISQTAKARRVKVYDFRGKQTDEGRISIKAALRDTPLLRISMIDVQQGDGMIIETPGGKVIFIDGGDNQLFARHAAFRYRGTSAADPLVVDLMLVTHGDADHFDGLNELRSSETDTRPGKAIFVAPRRYYHNGLVKRPDKAAGGNRRADVDFFGATTPVGDELFATALVDDPAALPAGERNTRFAAWMDTLAAWEPRVVATTGKAIERRRVNQRTTDAFDFLNDENIKVDLYGPIIEDTPAGPGLRFLRDPPDDAELMLGTKARKGGAFSASHTINGHSIAFRLRFGNVRMLFTGDLNQEAGQRLREALPDASLRCEILKAPHHGSADFDMEFLKEAGPVVSLISSGDESAVKEYIHPRATLMAALGKASRTTPAIIFVTELAAFFKTVGYVTRPGESGPHAKTFYAFERTNFGIIHVRTDGTRVLALTHSGKAGLNEAYSFTVSANSEVKFAAKASKVSAPPKAV